MHHRHHQQSHSHHYQHHQHQHQHHHHYLPPSSLSYMCIIHLSSLQLLTLSLMLILGQKDGILALDSSDTGSGRQPPATTQRRLFFAIAAPQSDALNYGRTFNKTLTAYMANNARASPTFSIDTMVIMLPQNGAFGVRLLEDVCHMWEGKHVIGVLIVGNTPAGFTVALTARHAGIPVLWVKGGNGFVSGLRGQDESRGVLEVQLAPSGRELAVALRGLLLQAHWHTFTLLADADSAATMRRPTFWATLDHLPLHPNLVALPSPLHPQTLFRKLADVSRSTRGVIVLLSGRAAAVRILLEAQRLNMMDGHFVWLWVDTATNTTFLNDTNSVMHFLHAAPTPAISVRRRSKEDFMSLPNNPRDSVFVQQRYDNLLNGELNRISRAVPKSPPDFLPSSSSSKSRTQHTKRFKPTLPPGLLSFRPVAVRADRHIVKGAVRLMFSSLKRTLNSTTAGPVRQAIDNGQLMNSCWKPLGAREFAFAMAFAKELKSATTDALAGNKFSVQEIGVDKVDKSLVASFEVFNLVPDRNGSTSNSSSSSSMKNDRGAPKVKWKRVGMVSGNNVRLDTIIWPGGDLAVAAVSTRARTVFRIVTALAPPFVMESALDEDGQCLRGLQCHRVLTADKDNLTMVFNELQRLEDEEDEQENEETKERHADYEGGGGGSGSGNVFSNGPDSGDFGDYFPFQKFKYRTNCCYGLSMDLLENVAQELEFDFRLYIVADGLFGGQTAGKWNGIVGDLISGAAHMSFAALSVSSARSEVIDFSAPYFFSGVSFLAAPQQKSEIPLMAFLLPFSPELWIAIFTSLNITAIAVAIYEWLSPFGLNPWGRQRSKNFSMSSALWVMWGLLCGHLVAFKAPKSWPNKFLINVWGGFSVIFVASYTANIAALIAGLFFHNTVGNYHDRSLLSQKVGAPKFSAAEYYVRKTNHQLWQHMHKYSLENIVQGVELLRNGTLDILIADTPILDYYRATDHRCKLQKVGDNIIEDTYAIGMAKGFPLKDSISAVIAKYSSNGYIDILQEKWYGGLPCFKLVTEIVQPRPLGVAAVTGVFILLGVGMIMGLLILLVEHLFFRYTLPTLRDKPKDSVWRSRNVMFFSQKLYRFINCVELVSPHHAARELVHTIRQGQITSLFQKSIKREHEQRRRRRSKAQFFEMIQEVRRQQAQQQQKEREKKLEPLHEDCEEDGSTETKSPSLLKRTFMRTTSPRNSTTGETSKKSPNLPLFSKNALLSPRVRKLSKITAVHLNVRRYSTDSVLTSHLERFNAVGRRLSKDLLSTSPPDINSRRSSHLDVGKETLTRKLSSGKSPILSIEDVSELTVQNELPLVRKLSDSETIGRKLATLSPSANVTKSADDLRTVTSPPVTIKVEDTSPVSEIKSSKRRDIDADTTTPNTPSASPSSDGKHLPPAPPPPNCSPRNLDGPSPLERLTKEELVTLWRSSESELRSHLLKAMRTKDPEPP